MAYFTSSKYFTKREFACKGKNCCGGESKMDMHFMLMLSQARSYADIPFCITSGYRCLIHNASDEVGSKDTSAHPKGLAADIDAANAKQRYLIVTSLLRAGFNRIGIGKDFVHVDYDHTKNPKRMWPY